MAAKLLGQTLQGELFCAQDARLVVGQAAFDEVEPLDHGAPEHDGELASQGLGREQAAAARGHAAIEAAEGDVLAAHETARHQTEDLSGAIASALDAPFSFAAVVTAGRQAGPRSEVFFARPLGQIGADFAEELQHAVVGVGGELREVATAAHLHEHLAKVVDLRSVDAGALSFAFVARFWIVARWRKQRLDLAIAFSDKALVVLPALQRLAQREDVLWGPGAAQRLLDALGLAALDLLVAQRQQAIGAALAGDDGTRTTARPLAPASELITSCSLTFMRSSAFCMCCTWLAAAAM